MALIERECAFTLCIMPYSTIKDRKGFIENYKPRQSSLLLLLLSLILPGGFEFPEYLSNFHTVTSLANSDGGIQSLAGTSMYERKIKVEHRETPLPLQPMNVKTNTEHISFCTVRLKCLQENK